jgi:hypothetical protein
LPLKRLNGTNRNSEMKILASSNDWWDSYNRILSWCNRVLTRIFWPKRDEVTGEWRKLHNEKLRDLYPSPSIIRIIKPRRMRWAGHVARMADKNAYRLLVGKPEGKRPLGRPRSWWVDNIRMDLGEVG